MRHVGGVMDVVGLTSKPKARQKKLVVIEVKRTRADLLADLKRKKMLRYERRSTHCYLAGTVEAFRADKLSSREIREDLKKRGLPVHWGLLLIDSNGAIESMRGARRHKHVQQRSLNALTRKVARSYMYRIMNPRSPMVLHD